MNSILASVVFLGCSFLAESTEFDAIILHGGSCEQTQYYKPFTYTNHSGTIDLGLQPYYYSAVATYAGRVFIIGGSGNANGSYPSNEVQIYDPMTSSTSMGGKMIQRRSLHTATRVGHKIAVCGGKNTYSNILKECEWYNPRTQVWDKFSHDLPNAVHSHGAAVLDNTLYVFGGNTYPAGPVADTYYFNHINGWVTSWKMPEPRADFSTAVVDGHIVTCGGFADASNTLLNSCDILDSNTKTWTRYTSMWTPKHYQFMIQYDNFYTFIFGGYTTFVGKSTNEVETYTPASNSSYPSYYPMEEPCAGFVAFVIGEQEKC